MSKFINKYIRYNSFNKKKLISLSYISTLHFTFHRLVIFSPIYEFSLLFCSLLSPTDWVIITGKLPTQSELISPVCNYGHFGNLRHLEDPIQSPSRWFCSCQAEQTPDLQCEIAVCNWAIKKIRRSGSTSCLGGYVNLVLRCTKWAFWWRLSKSKLGLQLQG